MSTVWLAWAGRSRAALLAFAVGLGESIALYVYALVSPPGAHGSEHYMFLWGLAIIAPMMILAALVGGAVAIVAGAAGARRRAGRAAGTLGESEEA